MSYKQTGTESLFNPAHGPLSGTVIDSKHLARATEAAVGSHQIDDTKVVPTNVFIHDINLKRPGKIVLCIYAQLLSAFMPFLQTQQQLE